MSKNVIVCLSVGDKYDSSYVVKLKNMVHRHCNVNFDFVCLSDKPIGGVDTILIDDPHELDPVWYKIRMLNDNKLHHYDTKLYFDLDVVIHNTIDVLFSENGKLRVIESKWKPKHEIDSFLNTGCNSSIMVWNRCNEITEMFDSNPTLFMCKYKGMDRFLWHEARHLFDFIQSDIVYSYSYGHSLADNTPTTMRADKSVCIYNGRVKPHDTHNEPARSFWK